MKNIKEHKVDPQNLSNENALLQQQLREAQKIIDLMKLGHIDALVVPDKTQLKVFAENTADKNYRIILEKMHEGAVTLNEAGTILYCNASFAKALK